MKMKFRAHESFFIRKGWLYKGLKNVNRKADVFTDNKTQNPMDTLGIGANMVKSLRYWLQAVGLTVEPNSGIRSQTFTELGQIIWDHDRYLEEMGTLWLFHYILATNKDSATAWYYFFNEFRFSTEFNKDDFVTAIGSWVKMNGEEFADTSYEGDFDCIMNTYVSRAKSNPSKVHPESNIDCPFGELGLVDIMSKKDKSFRKCTPKKDTLHPIIVLAVIIANMPEGEHEVRISVLQSDICNIGKIFNLDSVALTDYLYQIAALGYIKVVRTAGLDVVRIETNMNFLECVNEYYEKINQ